ncbi:hypothetical protein GCM10027176_37610 [Actinoallomurus bryophytorum]|uniref:Uncharacterized protein n=1 Tax=Actinoallomurus bryophytorum TaxID=1490222 RepID=A0A543CJ08_9ACTN|nr:hypothetical protein [Actinoallomurus bryophytorum]TQL97082.1 hypothetical protein FB559_2656 [Actinoallomurus bryophytorum]
MDHPADAADPGGRPPYATNRRIPVWLVAPALTLVTLASMLLLLRPAPAHAAASVHCAGAALEEVTLSAAFPQPDGVSWSVLGNLGTCKDLSTGKGTKVKGGTWTASGRATGTCANATMTGSATLVWDLADGGSATSTTGAETGKVGTSSVSLGLGTIDSGKFTGAPMVVTDFTPGIASILKRCPIEPRDLEGGKATLSIVG